MAASAVPSERHSFSVSRVLCSSIVLPVQWKASVSSTISVVLYNETCSDTFPWGDTSVQLPMEAQERWILLPLTYLNLILF